MYSWINRKKAGMNKNGVNEWNNPFIVPGSRTTISKTNAIAGIVDMSFLVIINPDIRKPDRRMIQYHATTTGFPWPMTYAG
jgi:hypothetical protein